MRLGLLSLYLMAVFVMMGVFLPFEAKAAESDISVNMSPENPAPGENTSITLSSYLYDLNSVLITWSVNGKKASSGIGEKSFSVNAGAAGSEIGVAATVALSDGSIDKKITIRPGVMVLLWQADDSYTPPFYKGKAMPSPGSEIKVVALPEVKSSSSFLDPKNMLYAWQLDYNNNQDGSGYGKNFFTYTNDYLENSNNISVTASTLDQKYSSDASIDISSVQPKILFYKNDPSLGTIWEEALGNGHKILGDETLEAAPYFISPQDIRIPSLTWDWSINDTFVGVSGLKKNQMPLKVQPGVSGTSDIKLEVNNTYKIFETVSGEINVSF